MYHNIYIKKCIQVIHLMLYTYIYIYIDMYILYRVFNVRCIMLLNELCLYFVVMNISSS